MNNHVTKPLLLLMAGILCFTAAKAQLKSQAKATAPKHHVCKGFKHFWATFQKYVADKDAEHLKKVFDLPNPILASVISSFNTFAYCDTAKLHKDNRLFDTLKITEQNFTKYYPRLFSGYLNNMILDRTIYEIEIENNGGFIPPLQNDSLCSDIYVRLLLSDSKQYKPCVDEGMQQIIEYELIFEFKLVDKQYRIVRIDAAG